MKSLSEVINEGLFNRFKNKYKTPYVIIEWDNAYTSDSDYDRAMGLKTIQGQIKEDCETIIRQALKRYGVSYSEHETQMHAVSTMQQLQFNFRHDIDVADFEDLSAEIYTYINKLVHAEYKNDAHIETEEEFEEWTIYIPFTKGSTDGRCINIYIGRE